MCYNDDLPGADIDPDAWNDEDKQSGDFNPEFSDPDHMNKPDED